MAGVAPAVGRRGAGVPLLTRYGVSPDADLVYRTLAHFGPQRATEVSAALDLSGRRVDAALEELAGYGAVTRSNGSATPRWRSTPPDRVVERLRRRQLAAARTRAEAHRRLAAVVELTGVDGLAGVDVTGASPGVRPLYGLERVRDRIGELVTAAGSEYLAMQPEPAFSAEAVRAAAPLDRSMVARGLTVLTLGVPASTDDVSDAHTLEMTGKGMQYRELPALPTKLIIADRRVVILPLDPHDTARGALEVVAPSAVDALVAMFLRRWEEGRPPQPGWASTMDLTPRERAVVTLLAAGHTDASAAEQLGLSVRTIAYTVKALMDRYGAANRFQLGLLIGAMGHPHAGKPDTAD